MFISVLVVFLVIIFSIIPGIAFAENSRNKVNNFIVGALLLPVLAACSGLLVFTLMSLPNGVMNSNWEYAIAVIAFFGVPLLVSFIAFYVLERCLR